MIVNQSQGTSQGNIGRHEDHASEVLPSMRWASRTANSTPSKSPDVQTKLCDARDDFDIPSTLRDGPAVLRDYTKSMKHYWREAAFIPDLADAGRSVAGGGPLPAVTGEDFAGGFVLRRFEEFTGAEVRTWWVEGDCRLCTAGIRTHPTTGPLADLDLDRHRTPAQEAGPAVRHGGSRAAYRRALARCRDRRRAGQ